MIDNTVHQLTHDISQSLTVINSFVSGCILRLESNNYTIKQLIEVMTKINHHVCLVGKITKQLQDYVDQIV